MKAYNSNFCDECEAKIKKAEPMECVLICSDCAKKGLNRRGSKLMKCAECRRVFMRGEAIFHSKYGYQCYICQDCAEKENISSTKIIAECKCGKQEINIENLINQYGYIDRFEWQCPVCWQIVTLTVSEEVR